MAATRIERDSMGEVEVPAERLWGAQTQRSLVHFPAGLPEDRMPLAVVRALCRIKRAVARTHAELGVVDPRITGAIAAAAEEVLSGTHDEEFPLSVWQTGSGTQTNMNVNEVLANRASELLGGPRGEGRLVHPNDHVNRGHSSNDAFPTAMHLAAVEALDELFPSLESLRAVLGEKAARFADVVKLGRTHLQDATPMTFGQEISGWSAQLAHADRQIVATRPPLFELALGGSAVGTGIGAHPELGARVAARLAEELGHPLRSAENKFAALASHDALASSHGALETLAVALHKIANDVRLLSSGPRAGLGELSIPENEPGSSIMPGKVNPTQAEALTMIAAHVLGNGVALRFGAANGHLQLNVYKPLIIHAYLRSARLLGEGMGTFREHCAEGLAPNRARAEELMRRSLMLVTALSPHVGYDRAAAIAKKAHAEGTTLREAAIASGLSPSDLDVWLHPKGMLGG